MADTGNIQSELNKVTTPTNQQNHSIYTLTPYHSPIFSFSDIPCIIQIAVCLSVCVHYPLSIIHHQSVRKEEPSQRRQPLQTHSSIGRHFRARHPSLTMFPADRRSFECQPSGF